MAVIHHRASRAGPDWGRGRSGVVAETPRGLGRRSRDRPNSRRPTSPYVPSIGRAWLLDPVTEVSGMRDYAQRLHFTPQGFRGMASPTEGEPISAA